ncbi:MULTISPECIES: hypothetical protein [Shewanella]|uniref:Uncharacterized protein n=1 Tax=Shewanella marisflavi TaxID=260364 RepID=A0AAC9U1V7_9GAMM|nr:MULTISPECIES: hypothetical protein [Shewanella]ASJ97637.1 hypothetical protein CFF01_14200 [Shewanella marisflavi]MCL1040562.1 hypothetical protein [Shewanella marisflavi]QDF76185.1 hypothetical protein FGA12_14105 [Shewanella marisflavi]
MKKIVVTLMLSLGLAGGASASQLAACNQDINSESCQHYLEGVVDGALMYKPNAMGKRVESNGYESRALKYRSGKRFEEANRTYCESRLPERETLVQGLAEAFEMGKIDSVDSLSEVMYDLMDCQRLK